MNNKYREIFMGELYFCGDDYLGLGRYGQSIRHIIEQSDKIVRSNDNDSFVIGINAPWGTGKTYFLNMLENALNNMWIKPGLDEKEAKKAEERTGLKGQVDPRSTLRVIYYDAWSNDFWDNAFEPFFDTVTEDIAGQNGVGSDELKKAFKSVGKIISIGFDAYLRKKVGDSYDTLKEMVETTIDGGESLIDGEYCMSSVFPEYASFKRAISSLKKLLQRVIKEFQDIHGKNSKIVIIVDELDRCKPLFSVQTLEIIKLFFNIEGLVFVFALDINQLQYCVKNVYGDQFDAENYLERFFNYLSNLPQGNYEPVIEHFNEEAKRKDNTWTGISNQLINVFSEIAKIYSMSLRDVRIVLSSLQVLEQTVLKKHAEYPYARILYCYFLALKYKDPDLYRQAFQEENISVFESLLTDRGIPYQKYEVDVPADDAMNLSNKRNDALCKVLVSEQKIKDIYLDFYRTDDPENIWISDWFKKTDGNSICGDKQDSYLFEEEFTLNYLLFKPDITTDFAISGKIFELTPSQYLNRQLEMINFVAKS